MLRRVRTPLLLVALLLALLGGSYWLWHGLRTSNNAEDSGAPTLGSSRKAVEFLSKDAPPAEPQPPLPPETPHSERQKLTRDRNGREPLPEAAASAELSGTLLDFEGRPVPGARVLLARWIEDERASEHAADRARLPARIPPSIAVHLPLDLADPASVGLPVPLRAQTDDSGHFSIALAPGRWRMLVRSTLAPYERNDLLLADREQRELAPILLQPGVVYSFGCKDAHGARAADIRAAPLLSGLGADFPPLAGALALPFLAPPPSGDEPQFSIPQRPIPQTLWLTGPHTRAQRVQLDPAKPALALTLLEADHLRGALQYSDPATRGAFSVHARPLDFFESPIPPEFRADIAQVRAGKHAFDLELPERATLYEVQATYGEEPPLLPSLWSPPRYAASDPGDDVQPQFDALREPLVWRPDAQVHFDLVPPQPLPSNEPIELLARGAYVRGCALDEPLVLPEHSTFLTGLRPLRGAAPTLVLRLPGTQAFAQPLTLVSGETCDLGRLALAALPMCRIQLTDASTSISIQRATVLTLDSFHLFGGSDPSDRFGPLLATTDDRGEARASAITLESSTFEIRAPNYAPAFVRASTRYADGSLPVRLYRGASVRLRVFDSDAAPLRAVAVECTRDEWTPDLGTPALLDTQSTDVEGYATFLHVTPGKHSFRIRSPHKLQPAEWSIVDLADESTRDVSLATRARARLKVRVLDASGPRANALLTLEPDISDLFPEPLPADDPLPYGIDAYTDSHGDASFEDLAPDRARLTLTLPDTPLRFRHSIRLRPGQQSLNFDLTDTNTLALTNPPTTSTTLDLRLLPPQITVDPGDTPISPDSLDLPHTSRLDRRHGSPDLTFSLPGDIELPEDLPAHFLLTTPLAAPPPAHILDFDTHTTPSASALTPALTAAATLDLTLLSLRPSERYVLLLARSPAAQLNAYLDANPDIRAQLTPAARNALSESLPDLLLLERTLPFVASSQSLTLTLTHLLPGETYLRLYRFAFNGAQLLPDSAPNSISLSADRTTSLNLTTRN